MTGNPSNLGSATGRILLNADGVRTGMEEAKRQAREGFGGLRDAFVGGMQQVGQTLTGIGQQMTVAMAPVGAALGLATQSALSFDETMTDVGAVLGLNRDEIEALKSTIREFGESTVYGPDKVARAYYDVVGGVSDASLHMAILEQSVRTANAGHADLGATTQALISVMNSYKLSADQAGLASDVLTRTVGMGVGTMDQLAAAMPQVTGLANSLNIPLEDLGAMFAYLSTQGNTFSQSGTQVGAMMTALLNPNEKMKDALESIGYATGSAAVEALGLKGTYDALLKAGYGDEMAGLAGNTEALRGVTALTGEDVDAFFTKYTEGLDGATAAAEQIQMGGAAAQVNLLKSSFEGLKIQVGEFLLPRLVDLAQHGKEVIGMVRDWITANPELTQKILEFVSALLPLGPILMGAGTAIKSIAGLMSILSSSLFLPLALIAGLYLAFKFNFLGIRDIVTSVVVFVRDIIRNDLMNEITALWDALKSGDPDAILNAVSDLFASIFNIIQFYAEDIKAALPDFVVTFLMAFAEISQGIADFLIPNLQLLYQWFVTDGIPAIKQALADALVAIGQFQNFLGGVWDYVQPKLVALAAWFTSDGIPWIKQALADALVAIGQFRDFLGSVWDYVQPKLVALANWFVADGIPWIKQALADALIGLGEFREFLFGVWDYVAPKLEEMRLWFMETALPAIKQELSEWIPGIRDAIDILKGWWDEISPTLGYISDWFVTTALPAIKEAITNFIESYVKDLSTQFTTMWNEVSPLLKKFYDWFKADGLPLIATAITTWLDVTWTPFVNAFAWLIDNAGPKLDEFSRKVSDIMDGIKGFIQPVIDLVDDLVEAIGKIKLPSLDVGNTKWPWERAEGGTYEAGGVMLTGERGPELQVTRSSGMIVNNDQFSTAIRVLGSMMRPVPLMASSSGGSMASSSGGGFQIGSVSISIPEITTDNPRQAGMEIAEGFERKLMEIIRSRG